MPDINTFYTLPISQNPWKIWYFLLFGPAIIGIVFYTIKTWRSTTWQPVAVLGLFLVAHVAYSVTAAHFLEKHVTVELLYAPEARSADAPKFAPAPAEAWRFTNDPTPEGSR